MAEFNMIFTHPETFPTMEYTPTNNEVIMIDLIPVMPTRIPKVYTENEIIPFFYMFEDANGNELKFERETREWDVVLPFGSASTLPRRNPTEIIYKGSKTKNKFM